MIADIPFECRDASAIGEGLGLGVVAAIIGCNADTLRLQREADRLANAAGAAGDYRYTCHQTLSPALFDGLGHTLAPQTHPASSRASKLRSIAMPPSLALRHGR